MDFDLSPELEDYRKKVREFAIKEFREDIAQKHDLEEKYPDDLRLKALKNGIIDFTNPWKTMLGIEG